jgi:flagellar hook-associated protein 3 FlgL
MRITLASEFQNALADIQTSATQLAQWQRQVSSGKRINSPSDDPLGSVVAIQQYADIATLDRYSKAGDAVNGRLSVTDSVLSDVVTQITAARSAAAGARSSTVSSTQRATFADQLAGIRDALLADVNTMFDGSHLFSGSVTNKAPYTQDNTGTVSAYQGDDQEVSVDINRHSAVRTTYDGQALAQGGDTDDVFKVLSDLITAVKAGDGTGIDKGLTNLQSAFDRATTLQGRVGNDLQIVSEQQAQLQNFKQAATTRLSATEDADMAQAITGLSQATTAYQAALGAVARITQYSLMNYLK